MPDRIEPYAERLIREAMERGEFDHLEGEGEPLAVLREPYEALWWVRRWVERERLREALAAEPGGDGGGCLAVEQ